MNTKKTTVIALGGSIAFQQQLEGDFLKEFVSLIHSHVKHGHRFVIVAGGGYLARFYQDRAAAIGKVSAEDRDWLGIYATKLNALLLRTLFRDTAHPDLFDEQGKITSFDAHNVIIGSGWSPGWSTDFVATQIAVDMNIDRVVILGKPSHVYTGDFEKDKTAQPLDELTWDGYLKLIPKEWQPGMSAPVDPVAARLAQKEGITTIVARGDELQNVHAILSDQDFIGTTIHS